MRDLQRREFFAALARNDMRATGFMGYVEIKTAKGVVSVSWQNAPRQTRRARLAYLLAQQDRLQREAETQ